MGFRINTNIGAMNAHRNATQTNLGLDKSLQRLSSGLRINTAADDASGLAIANQLRAQSTGLGQAIRNANDGIGVVQTADGALEEYENIINTVRTKSIQAASDGQNGDSRKAIQADIDRLLESANNIANQTQFNGQKLLDGSFTNKAFHIGAYAGETTKLSVGNVQTDSVGDIKSVQGQNTRAALDNTNVVEGDKGFVIKDDQFTVNGTDISPSLNKLSPTSLTDAKSIAAAITDATGILAQGTNTLIAADTIAGGEIDSTNYLKINGIAVANTTVLAGDTDGALVRAINDISDQTGVTAVNNGGTLELTSKDGSNIAISTSHEQPAIAQVDTVDFTGAMVSGDKISATVNGATVTETFATSHVATMTALATDIAGTDGADSATYNKATDAAVLLGDLDDGEDATWNGFTYNNDTGAAVDQDTWGAGLASAIDDDNNWSASYDSTSKTLTITADTGDEVPTGKFTIGAGGAAVDSETATADSLVVTGKADGTTLDLSFDISQSTGITADKVAVTTVGEKAISATEASDYVTGIAKGTSANDFLTDQTGTAVSALSSSQSANVVIGQGELIINGVDLAGTYGDSVTLGSAAADLQDAIQAIKGMEDSSIDATGAIKLVVNDGQDLNVAGSKAATDFGLTKGVTNDSKAGKVDVFSDGNVVIGGTDPDSFGFAAGNYAAHSNGLSLESINVGTRETAEVAIKIADSALKALDATRSDLGSVQNQLESTIRNISVTQVNVSAAESQIRDVDFAAESANFAKLNILAQSGSYAMSQANAVQQNVLRLLQ